MQRWKGSTMHKIDELKADAEKLPREELGKLLRRL